MSPFNAAAAILIASLLGAATPALACQAIDVAGNNNSVSCTTIKDGTPVRKAATAPKVNVAVKGDGIEVDVIVRNKQPAPEPARSPSPIEDEVVEGDPQQPPMIQRSFCFNDADTYLPLRAGPGPFAQRLAKIPGGSCDIIDLGERAEVVQPDGRYWWHHVAWNNEYGPIEGWVSEWYLQTADD